LFAGSDKVAIIVGRAQRQDVGRQSKDRRLIFGSPFRHSSRPRMYWRPE
jgi:hypothetical protein